MARRNTNEKKQIFSITAPGATSVMLAGDFTQWQEKAIPMQKQAGGVWKASVEIASGNHDYRFVVDGNGATTRGAYSAWPILTALKMP